MKEFFQRVVMVTLPRRQDRCDRSLAAMKRVGWPFLQPERFRAIDGGSNVVPTPTRWISGGGAFGCGQSHIQILQAALMDGIETLLVLEDDVEFKDTFVEELSVFMKEVPEDWECLMLGGQHMQPPEKISDAVVKCVNAQRTHAYAVRGRAIFDLCQMWQNSINHIDWDMGPFFGKRLRTYAPVRFIVGQSAGKSDINGRRNPAQFWNKPEFPNPSVWLQVSGKVASELRTYGFHYGFALGENGADSQLDEVMRTAEGDIARRIRAWKERIQWECESFPGVSGICAIWHPMTSRLSTDWMSMTDPSPIISAQDCKEAVAKYHEITGILPVPSPDFFPPVALLQCSKQTVSALMEIGLIHCGNWRDPATEIDQGLERKVFADPQTQTLFQWFEVIAKEADRKNALPGIFHPLATEDMVHDLFRKVLIIDHDDVDLAAKAIKDELSKVGSFFGGQVR